MNLLDVWVDILCIYCKKLIDGVVPKYTENFNDTKNSYGE